MSFFLKYFLILILILNVSCKSNKPEDISVISEKEIDLQMIDAYKEGLLFLEKGDGLSASNKFNEAEPDSDIATSLQKDFELFEAFIALVIKQQALAYNTINTKLSQWDSETKNSGSFLT